MSAKKTAFYGMFLALALVAGYIEQLIPINLGIPGVKLGLANIITMLLLYIVGVPAACLISVLRILLSGFLFGSWIRNGLQCSRSGNEYASYGTLKENKEVFFCRSKRSRRHLPQRRTDYRCHDYIGNKGISLLSPNFNPFWTRSRNLNRNLKRDINKEIKSDNQAAFCINRRKL